MQFTKWILESHTHTKKKTLDFITLIDALLLIFQFPMDYLVCFKTDYTKDFQICKWEFKHPGATHIFTSCNSWTLNLFDKMLLPLSSPPDWNLKTVSYTQLHEASLNYYLPGTLSANESKQLYQNVVQMVADISY